MSSFSSALPTSIIAVLAVCIYIYVQSITEHVLVTTSIGALKGFKAFTRTGRKFNAFHSIPYAKPPTGERRFQVPVEFGRWDGVLDATVPIPTCLQADVVFKRFTGQEDCLVLNVFTPNIPGDSLNQVTVEPLPVLIFFHGGHWMSGGSEIYTPDYFLDEDVVLVTVNYRLGALGFLNTGDGIVSGNMGLKDQVLALKWIQKHIGTFGGNPDLVTIFGESAGGAIVDLHTLSPMSKGLFHRSISQSGTSLCPWAITGNPDVAAKKLGSTIGCPTEKPRELVKCLKQVDGKKIVETHKDIFSPFHSPQAVFGPTIEIKPSNGDEPAFLTELPTKILKEDRQPSKVPHLFGVNSHEGCYRSAAILPNQHYADKVESEWNDVAPNVFMYDKEYSKGPKTRQSETEPTATKILHQYFGSKIPPDFSLQHYDQFTQALSDRLFFKCTSDAGRLHSAHAPTYMYWLGYNNTGFTIGDGIAAGHARENHMFPMLLDVIVAYLKKALYQLLGWATFNYGVCHADDLSYLFLVDPIFAIKPGSEHYEFSRSLVRTWVTFAKNGYPGPFRGVEWSQVNPNASVVSCMQLDREAKMVKECFTSGTKFWSLLGI